mgnify:CR=1 FL=1
MTPEKGFERTYEELKLDRKNATEHDPEKVLNVPTPKI